MPNNNTIAQAKVAGGGLPSDSLGASSTSEFAFSKTVVEGGTSTSRNLSIAVPGAEKLKNKPIRIRAWGRVTGGTTTNFTVKIYSGTVAAGTSLATTGAIAVNSVSGNFNLVIEGVWDSTSDKLQGIFKGHVNGTAVAQVITSSVTQPAIDPSLETFALSASGQFSGSHASNAAILDGLELEAL